MICDRAGWHQRGKEIKSPHNIVLLPLPSYAPELNSMENVWDYRREVVPIRWTGNGAS